MNQVELQNFADYLSKYIMQKIDAQMSTYVRFYRAEVTKTAINGLITVKRPFDDTEQAIPYVQSMSNATVGSQVIVFVFGSSGNANNSVIVNDGKFSK